MGGIFLSYRRNDSSGHTGRLTDDLREAFPDHSIFRDIDTIAPGADFALAIDAAVGQADVVLAVIGRHWCADRRRSSRPCAWGRPTTTCSWRSWPPSTRASW